MVVYEYLNGVMLANHGEDSKLSDYASLKPIFKDRNSEVPYNVIASPLEH